MECSHMCSGNNCRQPVCNGNNEADELEHAFVTAISTLDERTEAIYVIKSLLRI